MRAWSDVNVGVVGATGVVGEECLAILRERGVPAARVRAFASARSAGGAAPYGRDRLTLETLDGRDGPFDGLDAVVFAADADTSRTWAPRAVEAGCWAVDNSSAFRMDPAVPLVVPEVNANELDALHGPSLIANPNCSTIIALVAVTPIHRVAPVRRMVVSTYQAVSGAGREAMRELEEQARAFAAGAAREPGVFGRPCLFNVFCHESAVGPDGYNVEETKLLLETRKIWRDDEIAISATCVRVPVPRVHCESINLTLAAPLTESSAREAISSAPGLTIVDDRSHRRFPEPVLATGRDEVFVGRIRADRGQAPGVGLELFVAGDQIRKGAALNAAQILDRVLGLAPVTAVETATAAR